MKAERKRWNVISLAALAMVATMAVACAKAPSDATLATNIKAAMFSDGQLKDANLDVTVNEGVVTLTGTVANDAARAEAQKIATQTAGVKKVDDQMTVQVARETPTAAPAPAIAAAPETAPPKPTEAERRERKHATPQNLQPSPAPDTASSRDESAAATPSDAAEPASPETPAPTIAPNAAPAAPTAPADAALASQQQTAPAPPSPSPEPHDVTVASGTTMTVRMIDSIDSKVNHAGEVFHASLENPLTVDKNVIVPKGTDIYVRLTQGPSATGKESLHLELLKMDFQGRSYSLVSSTSAVAGKPNGKRAAKNVVGGAVLGTLLGAVIGGGRGAAIGAAVGAAGGGIYTDATKTGRVKVPSETKLDFELEQPVVLGFT